MWEFISNYHNINVFNLGLIKKCSMVENVKYWFKEIITKTTIVVYIWEFYMNI